jgi:anti-sigma-K factor RskA
MSGSSHEREDSRGGCGLDVAAYALGALEPGEAEDFAAHLETCAMCREELADYQVVLASLPMTVPGRTAPESLRRRVLDTVRDEAQLRAPEKAPPHRSARWNWLFARPAVALAGAMAVLALAVFGGLELGGSAPQTRVYKAQVTGSSATARVLVTDGRGRLIVRHLPPPPKGKIYEVWLARAHGVPQPTTALFSVTQDGSGDVAVPGSLRGVRVMMVTPEPAGGSRVPTHTPVISARLT